MSSVEPPPGKEEEYAEYRAEVNRYLKRNYWAHIIEGGIYMAGTALVSVETVMPAMVRDLGGSPGLVALVPLLILIRFALPPIFNANFVERLHRMKRFVVILGICQRLPFLIAGIALLALGETRPHLALAFVVLAPFLSGLLGGIGITAWYELVCRVIPEKKMAESWSMRFLLQGLGGLAAGGIVAAVMANWPGTKGYGILMLSTYGVLMVSFFVFLRIHEVVPPTERVMRENESWFAGWKRRFRMIREDPILKRFLYARALGFSIFLPAPFMGLHALAVTGRGEDFLGALIIAQMAGSILANAIIVPLGSRVSAVQLVMASRAAMLLVCVLILFVSAPIGFLALFFCFGASFSANGVGFTTLMAQISPPGMRPSYLVIQSVLMLPVMLATAGMGGWIMKNLGGITALAITALLLQLASGWFVRHLPRRGRTP